MNYIRFAATLLLLPALSLSQEALNLSGPLVSVPAGTHIQLELITKLSTRGSRRGEVVRAQTAFPVAVNGRVVIPPGTFVEGTLDQITPRSTQAKFHMSFNRVLFANGYTVQGGDGQASARLEPPAAQPLPVGAFGFQTTTVPTPTLPGPPASFQNARNAIIGAAIGSAVLVAVIAILNSRHPRDFAIDPGTKFEMILQNDLTFEATQAGI